MEGAEVLSGGLLSTVQDEGRFGWQAYGLPAAGAMDWYAFQTGNMLLGNAAEVAALEITLAGPTLRFTCNSMVAVTGAPLPVLLNGKEMPLWQSFVVKTGQQLSLGAVSAGCRAYLCVAGGILVPKVLGSRSTYLRGQLGGVDGRELAAGDFLPLEPCTAVGREGLYLLPEAIPAYPKSQSVRVMLGPQDDYFSIDALNALLHSEYKITPESDRMGYRLDGPQLTHKESADIISDGVVPGALQVPGHGTPIIMMADRPTTGGYPKIATVITADLWKVAQLKPGDSIRFQEVDFYQARQALYETRALLQSIFTPNSRLFNVRVNGKKYFVRVRELEDE
ncbi:5-oxoprolinase subunit C family protein [Dethiobacter alkaliphilus]|uniref:Urea amidolyase related protein n=1 Tax=Dethiobacter alkaliphilus AHT 1 TaxID=555088 RepID=C0GH22_DETAL|nr:biotin-dependent carboxyltransferase family protein [Dethiobacter alkaliphilus]EEG77324.1 urea amidolyase related protein [Dethiobacter alkaliphilus AHT 1]